MTTALHAVPSGPMADEGDSNNTKARTIRMEDELWGPLGPAALTNGLDRSKLLRQFARWYLSVPGAQLPRRPESPATAVEQQERAQ